MKKQGVFLGEIKAESTEAQIDIVGVIGWEVAFTQMKDLIASIPDSVGRVVFNIYSPGGDVLDGNGIVQAIGELSKRKETVAKVQVAASMATLIAVACNKRSIAANGRFLVHNPWTVVQGDGLELEKRAKELRDCETEMSAFYANRTGKTQEEMLALMNEERWLNPEETKSFGFVQEIDDPFKPEEMAAVKAEIEAAGKWPKALVIDMEQPKQEEGDGDGKTEGGEGEGKGKPDGGESGAANDGIKPIIEQARKEGFDSGMASGLSKGLSEGEAKRIAEASALQEQLRAASKVASKYQGERDALQARVSAMEKTHADEVKRLTEMLDDSTKRISKLLDGALTFSSEPKTWEEAMKACGNDYVAAAKKYPELKSAYNEKKRNERK